jgi:serine O-acetyltransferase
MDRERLIQFLESQPSGRPLFLITCPSYQAVLLYRLSHYFFKNGRRLLGRFFWHVNLILTGADINPISDIDGGFVLISPLCVTIVGKVGKNSTWFTQSGIGGGRSPKDIGGGPGLPVCGDGIDFGSGSMVVGPVRVGDRSKLGPRCIVLEDVPPDSSVKCPSYAVKAIREGVHARNVDELKEKVGR